MLATLVGTRGDEGEGRGIRCDARFPSTDPGYLGTRGGSHGPSPEAARASARAVTSVGLLTPEFSTWGRLDVTLRTEPTKQTEHPKATGHLGAPSPPFGSAVHRLDVTGSLLSKP